MVGGSVALAGTILLGARIGRFPKHEKARMIRSHSTPVREERG